VLRIMHVNRAYRRAVNRALAAHGLSDSQALPVRFIAQLGDGVRQGVLAEHVGVEGPSLARQLDQLCAAGLVERRADPHDRRGRTLHLTAQGRALAGTIAGILGELRQQLMRNIADAGLHTTLEALACLAQAIEAAEPGGRG